MSSEEDEFSMFSIYIDYQTKRKAHVLKELFLEVLPTQTYYGWMEKQGKMGGQHKFPRVLRGQARLDFIWSNR